MPDDAGARADRALDALRRRHAGSARSPFTSDLSVDELLLVKEAGYEPRALVSGNAIHDMQPPPYMWGISQEMTTLTQALYGARQKAMEGMREEATRVGGDGVVGVRLTLDLKSWGEGLGEFLAVGTAMRGRGLRAHLSVFTSNLSGRDFYALVQAGHHPVSMVMGACVWHLPRRRLVEWLGRRGRNYELEAYTTCLYAARELAMTRMAAEAEAAQATGIVGVRIEQRSHAWGPHTIEFLAIGTAVRPLGRIRKVLGLTPAHARPLPAIGLHRP